MPNILLAAAVLWAAPATADPWSEDRRSMVAEIEAIAEAVGPVAERNRLDSRVLRVMGEVPRHRFVPESLQAQAYADRPLPIGYGQTISQPYIVALMTDQLRLSGDETVLEVGTGSGYQAAVLGHLVERVMTIEIVPRLAEPAARRLADLDFENVVVRQGDGYFGWPDEAPFDAIVVTAAAEHIPPPLIHQLKPGGRMVIPVGNPFLVQRLMLVEKAADGGVRTRSLLPVRFVPLTGDH